MQELALVIGVIAAFFFGYYARQVVNNLKQLEKLLELKPEKEPEAGSVLLDPDDPIQRAEFEHSQLMKDINRGP